jgi:fatty-acyl-CoA synthase
MYLPLFHAFGLYEGPLMSLVTGARQVLMEHFDPGEALRLMASERVTMIHGFDTHFQDLMEHAACAQTDRSSLRTGLLAAGLASTEPVARRAQRGLCHTGACSHFSGQVSSRARCEVAIRFNMFHRPAL